ncbi:MAG: hypothetical protein E6G90_04090 [Alphaproteobacteria bacterium]|nr:MAG: hypothetical protein E6G90_04090 [Alphaproteobacteria bacterium]
MRSTSIAAVFIAFLVVPASAQNPPATTPMRVAGTVDKLDGNKLTVNMKDGQAVAVVLADNAVVFGVEKRTVADIKPGDFLASGGVKGTDGKIHAVEVRIFPETLRGTGEGQRPWDAKPDGVMTNATVGTVSQSPEGGVIHVKYKDGESEFTVGPEVPVLAYVAGDRSLLKPGAAIVTVAQKKPDGTLTTGRVTAEKDGVRPPM